MISINLIVAIMAVIVPTVASGIWYRLANLKHPQEHEEYLVSTLEDSGWKKEYMTARFESLSLIQSTNRLYKIRRILYGILDGHVRLRIYTDFLIGKAILEDEQLNKCYHMPLSYNVEILDSNEIDSGRYVTTLRIDSIERSDIEESVDALLTFISIIDRRYIENYIKFRYLEKY